MVTQAEFDELGTIRASDLTRLSLSHPAIREFLERAEWNPNRGVYTLNNQTVTADELRSLVTMERAALETKLAIATDSYLDNQTTLDEWQETFADDQKTSIVAVVLLAIGGITAALQNPNARIIWSQTGRLLRDEFTGVRIFTNKTENGERSGPLAKNYGSYKSRSVRPAFEQARKTILRFVGFNEGRRFLDPTADHCVDCPGHERLDWVPIDEIVPVGVDCVCRGRCRCSVQYRVNLSSSLQRLIQP